MLALGPASTPIFVDGQGSNHSSLAAQYLAAAFGLTDSMQAIDGMLDFIENKTSPMRGDEPACSCMGAHWLLQGLYRLGHRQSRAADLALEFLVSPYTWRLMLDV